MKFLLLILIIVFQNTVFSQVPVEELNAALKSERYSTFKKKLYEARKNKLIEPGNTIVREIINDYKEVWYEIYDTIEWDSHNIKLVTKGDRIILYYFSVNRVKRDNDKRIFFVQVIDSFRNASLYSRFKLDFKKIYEIDLSEDDLWKNKVVGVQCGMIIDPNDKLKDYIQMEHYVASQKRDSLLLWLRSANIERQMFGLWGFSILKHTGHALTETELKFVRIALKRKGYGTECGGCEARPVTMKEFAKGLNLE